MFHFDCLRNATSNTNSNCLRRKIFRVWIARNIFHQFGSNAILYAHRNCLFDKGWRAILQYSQVTFAVFSFSFVSMTVGWWSPVNENFPFCEVTSEREKSCCLRNKTHSEILYIQWYASKIDSRTFRQIHFITTISIRLTILIKYAYPLNNINELH